MSGMAGLVPAWPEPLFRVTSWLGTARPEFPDASAATNSADISRISRDALARC